MTDGFAKAVAFGRQLRDLELLGRARVLTIGLPTSVKLRLGAERIQATVMALVFEPHFARHTFERRVFGALRIDWGAFSNGVLATFQFFVGGADGNGVASTSALGGGRRISPMHDFRCRFGGTL